MGYHKSLINKLRKVVESSSPEDIKDFERDLRENIRNSNRLSITALVFMMTFFVTHYLLFSGSIDETQIHIFTLHNSAFLRLVILWFGGLCFLAMMLSDFMWRCHREIYDYIYILQKSEFTKTGLNDFRIPVSYSLALDLFRDDGSRISKFLANISNKYITIITVFLPILYLLKAVYSEESIRVDDLHWFYIFVAASSVFFAFFGIVIMIKSARVSSPEIISSHMDPL